MKELALNLSLQEVDFCLLSALKEGREKGRGEALLERELISRSALAAYVSSGLVPEHYTAQPLTLALYYTNHLTE